MLDNQSTPMLVKQLMVTLPNQLMLTVLAVTAVKPSMPTPDQLLMVTL
jgi:hypothetical protein